MVNNNQLEQPHQFTHLASKSSSRLRLSDDWSRSNLTTSDTATYTPTTRHVESKASVAVAAAPATSQVDASDQASESLSRTHTPKPRLNTTNPTSPLYLLRCDMPISHMSLQPRRQSQHQSSPFLTVMPHDLHYILATKYLDFDTILALRQTCHTMHTLFNPQLIRRIRTGIIKESLQSEVQQFKSYRSMYPRQRLGHLWDLLYYAFDFRLIERPAKELRCYGCLETKPLWDFVERMSNKGTGLGARFAHDRMCKDCMRRYRDVEGQWWKENWVKKSDTVRKSSRAKRIKRWVVEGGSLLNPDREVGVCSCCGSGTFELWWGCADCFELEEKRRREEDLDKYLGWKRKAIDVVETWKVRKEGRRRKRVANRERTGGTRGRRRWYNVDLGLSDWNWEGGVTDRLAALLEWTESKTQHEVTKDTSIHTLNPLRSRSDSRPWRAIDQIPLPENRRVARCSSCWVPNCPRRTYILGLAYERPLPRERWCRGCHDDYDARHAKRRVSRSRTTSSRRRDPDAAANVFGDAWMDGLGDLFDERL